MRSDAGGPYIMLEGGHTSTASDPRIAEVYSLLYDNVYPEYINYPQKNSWGRSFWSPTLAGDDDLSGIGTASGPATVDSTAVSWDIRRTYSNGEVSIRIPTRSLFDCDTDTVNYMARIGTDTVRLSADWSSFDYVAPVDVSFYVYAPDSIGDSLAYYFEVTEAAPEDTLALQVFHQIYVLGWTGFESGFEASVPPEDGEYSNYVQTAFDLDDLSAGDSIMVRIRAADFPELSYTDWDTTIALFARQAPPDETAPTVSVHTASWDSTTQAGNLLTLFASTEANEDAYHRTAVMSGVDTVFGAWTDTVIAAGDTLYWTFEEDSTMDQIGGQEYSIIAWAKDDSLNISDPDTVNQTITRAP